MTKTQPIGKRHQGIKRLLYAFKHSYQGPRHLIKHESAFRQECCLFVILSVVAFLLDVTTFERAMLIASCIFVLVVEALNTAIEVVVDRIGAEVHHLSGAAKDVGSFAVLCALILAAIVWGGILL